MRTTTSSGASRKLSAKAASEVVFFPDAGPVRNINVLSDYFKTFKLLNDWGIPTCVAWWGQFPEGLADLVAQIVKVRLLHSDLLPTPVRAIDHRLAAKLQDAKSQLQELAAVHDAAELREAPACFQRVCSSFDTWPWSYLLWPWSNLFWLWSCLFWPWPCQNKMYRTRAKRLAFEFVRARTGGVDRDGEGEGKDV